MSTFLSWCTFNHRVSSFLVSFFLKLSVIHNLKESTFFTCSTLHFQSPQKKLDSRSCDSWTIRCCSKHIPSHTGHPVQRSTIGFTPHRCRLCGNRNRRVYGYRTGLNRHANIHHDCWYRTRGDLKCSLDSHGVVRGDQVVS